MNKFVDFIDDIKFYFDKYIIEPFRNLKWFFINLKIFWNDLWEFRPWDHEYCKDIYCTALDALKEDIYRNSFEIPETRMKKVEAMEELLMLLQMDISDNFDQLIKLKKNGRFDFNKFNTAVTKGEKKRKERIIRLLAGQSEKEIKKLYDIYKVQHDELKKKHPNIYKSYSLSEDVSETVDDGTGVDCWWD